MKRCPLCLYSFEMFHKFITYSKKELWICLGCYTIVTNRLLN